MKNIFWILLLFGITAPLSAQTEEEVIDAVIEEEPMRPIAAPKPRSAKKQSSNTRGYRGQSGGRYGFYLGQEWFIPPVYDALPKELSDFMVAKKDKKYGIIDSKNRVLIPFAYDKIYAVLKSWESREQTGYFKAEKGKLQGLLSKDGKFTIPVVYDYFQRDKDFNYSVGNKGKTYGLTAQDGTEIFPLIYESPISRVSEDRYRTEKNGLIGMMNREGKELLPFVYEEITSDKGRMKYKRNGQWGFMDEEYHEITPPQYDYLAVQNNGMTVSSKNDKQGVLNSALEVVIPAEYERLKIIHPRYFRGRKDEGNGYTYGVIDTFGTVVLPFEFREIKRGPGDMIFAQEGVLERIPLYGVFDEKGKAVTPYIYRSVGLVGADFAAVKLTADGKYALMDSKGKILTEYLYDRIKKKSTGRGDYVLVAERGDFIGTLRPDGTENDDFKSTAPQRNQARAREQDREQNVFRQLTGEWYGMQKIGQKEYLVNISILSNTTGIRTVYFLEKDKECSVEQYFSPALLSTMSTLLFKINSRELNVKCDNPPADFNTRNDNLFRGGTLNLAGKFGKVSIKDFMRKESDVNTTDSYETLRFIRQMRPIADDLQSKVETRPGGISNPQFVISPTTREVKLVSYGTDDFGKIELQDDGYIFVPRKWVGSHNYSLSGILRNVRYRAADGKIKTGDLDICFDAMQSKPFFFKELK